MQMPSVIACPECHRKMRVNLSVDSFTRQDDKIIWQFSWEGKQEVQHDCEESDVAANMREFNKLLGEV